MFNTLSEYTYFYISKNITSYTYLLVFKIAESLPLFMREKWTQDKQIKSYVFSIEKRCIENPNRIQSVTTFAKRLSSTTYSVSHLIFQISIKDCTESWSLVL